MFEADGEAAAMVRARRGALHQANAQRYVQALMVAVLFSALLVRDSLCQNTLGSAEKPVARKLVVRLQPLERYQASYSAHRFPRLLELALQPCVRKTVLA